MRPRPAFLFFCTIVFGGFGLVALLAPEWAGATVGIELKSAAARVDFRAVYGGLPVGLATFFALSAIRRGWLLSGLWAAFLSFGGLAVGRFGAVLLDGIGSALLLLFLLLEFAGAGYALFLILKPETTVTEEKSA